MRTGLQGRTDVKSSPRWNTEDPEGPTLTEWMIGLLPLPYLGGGLLLAVLISPLGDVLALYLDTWDLTVAFTALPPGPAWLVPVQVMLWVAVPFSVVWATRTMRRKVVQAKSSIAPLLPSGEETYSRVFLSLTSFRWPVGAAVLLFALFTLQAGLPTGGPWTQAFDYVFGYLYLLLLSVFIGVYLTATLGLHSLGKQSLKLKPYHEDPMLGLRPLGALSLFLARPFLLVTAVVALWISVNWPLLSNAETIAFVTALAVVGVGMFFLPLNRVHGAMLRERERTLASVQGQLRQLMGDPGIPGDGHSETTLSDVMEGLRELKQLQTLEVTERRLRKAPVWPFDTRALRRLATTTLAIVTVLASRFIAIRLFGL
jgi:hypothetical protein